MVRCASFWKGKDMRAAGVQAMAEEISETHCAITQTDHDVGTRKGALMTDQGAPGAPLDLEYFQQRLERIKGAKSWRLHSSFTNQEVAEILADCARLRDALAGQQWQPIESCPPETDFVIGAWPCTGSPNGWDVGGCTVCRATFSETGQHTHQPWMAWGPSYRICRWCVQAGRDERRRRERESASPAVRAPREPEATKMGIRVFCTVCDLTKKPIGRAGPLGAEYCTDACRGYRMEPFPGSLWPGETDAEFGFPCNDDATVALGALRAPQQEQNDERIRDIGAASSTDTERTSQTLDAVERARAEGHPTE